MDNGGGDGFDGRGLDGGFGDIRMERLGLRNDEVRASARESMTAAATAVAVAEVREWIVRAAALVLLIC